MNIPKTLHYKPSDATPAELRNENGEAIAIPVGGRAGMEQRMGAVAERYNAPLIILGRAEELRDGPTDRFCPVQSLSPQWHVVHAGERKLMTRAEIDDLVFALEFTE